jgi:hypothetical protein
MVLAGRATQAACARWGRLGHVEFDPKPISN